MAIISFAAFPTLHIRLQGYTIPASCTWSLFVTLYVFRLLLKCRVATLTGATETETETDLLLPPTTTQARQRHRAYHVSCKFLLWIVNCSTRLREVI